MINISLRVHAPNPATHRYRAIPGKNGACKVCHRGFPVLVENDGGAMKLRDTGMTLSDWRAIYHIYQPPRWTKAEAKEMLRNWMLYAVDMAMERSADSGVPKMKVTVELDPTTSEALLTWAELDARSPQNAAMIAVMAFLKAQGLKVGELPERYQVVDTASLGLGPAQAPAPER